MILNRTRQQKNIIVKYGDQPVNINTCIKYLGIWIDKNISFHRQVKEVIQSCKEKTASLCKYFITKKVVSQASRSTLYKFLIQPKLTYGVPAWHHISESDLKIIQKYEPERKWARIILWLPKCTTKNYLNSNLPFESFEQARRRIGEKFRAEAVNHANPLIQQTDALPPARKKTTATRPLSTWFF